jgi:MFS family permease
MTHASTGQSSGYDPYPSPRYGWYVVTVLTLGYVVSFVDRQILALLVEPIKHDLDISDTEVSLLLGAAFAFLYTFAGIPIGLLADRRSRRAIIATGITIWCFMTAACGLARNFAQLFLARVGVGIGEATLSPSALSLISDYFPRETRGRAISFYNMGVGVGAGLAMVLGGQVIEYVFQAPPLSVPLVGELFAWQTVFLVVGLPGLLIALLMITVKEPKRKGKIQIQTKSGLTTDVIPFTHVVKFLGARWRTYGNHFLGMSVVTILGYAYFSWLPTMFVRTWSWTIGEVSFAYGVVMLICAPLGVNLGGWLADTMYRNGHKDAHAKATFYAVLVMAPASVAIPLMPSGELAVALLVPSSIAGASATATGAAALMIIAPNQMRAQASAVYYFVINLLGLNLGPTAVALFTDYVFADEAALRYSISIVSAIAGTIGMVFIVMSFKHFRASVVEAEAWGAADGAVSI